MDSKIGVHVMTLANSIIGVSILAMPYCFKQCGIILSIVLLVISSAISRLACHFLMKSAMKARLRTFEFLAYHVFGSLGKLFVEIGLIGFLIGTCIAYFVVMGDLGPQIIAQLTETQNTDTLRTSILIILAVFCVLPLGLLRNVDSLSGVCTATIGFYACLVLKIMGESAPHLLLGDWMEQVNFWRPAGVLQCLPIFSMALCCQTQLFEIYQVIQNASLEKMNDVVRLAVYICTCVYIFVGVFGYIAISHEANFSGNILLNFKPSIMTEIMKIGFVLSLAFSFPLCIFPCRASLYSLLYKPTYSALHETTSVYIPEGRFRLLTFIIVLISLVIGVLIPNIELVLGLVGSTIGIMVCVIFPAACFICITSRNTNERLIAQVMLMIGIVVMVLGTYANLYAIDQVAHTAITEKSFSGKDIHVNINIASPKEEKSFITTLKNIAADIVEKEETLKEVRHEPVQPEAPVEESQAEVKQSEQKALEAIEKKLSEDAKDIRHEPPQPIPPDSKDKSDPKGNISKETVLLQPDILKPESKIEEVAVATTQSKPIKETLLEVNKQKSDDIAEEAIKKEDNELESNKNVDSHMENQETLNKLLEQNKKLVEELQQQQAQEREDLKKVKEEKLKAVKSIENIAKLAIESLVDTPAKAVNNLPIAEPLSYKLGLKLNKTESKLDTADIQMPKGANILNILSGGTFNNSIKVSNDSAKKADLGNVVLPEIVAKPAEDKNDLAAKIEKGGEKETAAKQQEVIDKQQGKDNTAEKLKNIAKTQEAISVDIEITKLKAETASKAPAKIEKAAVVETAKSPVVNSPEVPAPAAEDKKNGEAIRRDILANDDYNRKKREAEQEHCEKNVTDEFSEFDLKVDIGKVDSISLQTRDLKSIKEK